MECIPQLQDVYFKARDSIISNVSVLHCSQMIQTNLLTHSKKHSITNVARIFEQQRLNERAVVQGSDVWELLKGFLAVVNHYSALADPRAATLRILLVKLTSLLEKSPHLAKVAVQALHVTMLVSLLRIQGYVPRSIFSKPKLMKRGLMKLDLLGKAPKASWNPSMLPNSAAFASKYESKVKYTPFFPRETKNAAFSMKFPVTTKKAVLGKSDFSVVCRKESDVSEYWRHAFGHAAYCALLGDADSRYHLILTNGKELYVPEELEVQFHHPLKSRLYELASYGTKILRLRIMTTVFRKYSGTDPSPVGGGAISFWKTVDQFYKWYQHKLHHLAHTLSRGMFTLDTLWVKTKDMRREMIYIARLCLLQDPPYVFQDQELEIPCCINCLINRDKSSWFFCMPCYCGFPSGKELQTKIYDTIIQEEASFLFHNPTHRDVGLSLLEGSLRYLMDSTEIWVTQGRLHDPTKEFFIAQHGRSDGNYQLDTTKLPSFLSSSWAENVYEIGMNLRLLEKSDELPMIAINPLQLTSPSQINVCRRTTDRLIFCFNAMELLKVETAWKKIELTPQPRTPKSQPRKRLLHEVVSPTRSEPNVRTPRPLNSEAIVLTSPAPLAVQSPPAKVGPEETGTPRTDSKRRDSESPSVLGLLSRQEVWEQAIQQAKEEMKREHDRKLKEVEERTKRIQWKRKRMVLRKKRIEKLFSPWLDEDETPVMTVPTTDNTISHQQEVPHVEQPSPQTDPTDAPALTKEVIVPPPIPPSTVPDVTAAQPSVPPRAQSPPKLSHDVQTVTTQDTLSNTQVETTCNVQLKKGGVCGRVRPCRYHDAKDEGKKVETSKNPTESPAVVSQGGAITSESATPPVVPTSVPKVDTKPPPEEERRQDVDPVVTHPEPPQEIVATTSKSDSVIPTQSPLALTTSELPKNHHHQQTFQISEMFIQPEPATDKRLDLHELIQTAVLSLPRHNHFSAGHQLQAKPWIKDFTNEDSTTTKSSSWCTTNVDDLVHYSLIYPISILQHNTNMIVLQHMYEDIDIVALFKNDIFGICFFHNGIFGDTFCSQVFEELRSFRSRPGQDLCNS
eukprot:PhF_6_TR36496/c2_g1_i2/m.53665